MRTVPLFISVLIISVSACTSISGDDIRRFEIHFLEASDAAFEQTVLISNEPSIGIYWHRDNPKWRSVALPEYDLIIASTTKICANLGTSEVRTNHQGSHGFFLEINCGGRWTSSVDLRFTNPTVLQNVTELDMILKKVFGRQYMAMNPQN